MPRYIDAELLLRKSIQERRFFICTENLIKGGCDVQTVYNDLAEFVESIPTVDVAEVKRGTWLRETDKGVDYAKCSACGGTMSIFCYGHDYCPNCGAKMDGKKVW